MPAIGPDTRARIKAYLAGVIETLVKRHRQRAIETLGEPTAYLARRVTSEERTLRPFHAAIIPPQLRRISAFERGFSTALGSTYEECACLIALDHHEEAQRGYNLAGKVSAHALEEIERQLTPFEPAPEGPTRPKKPTFEQMVDAVLNAQWPDDSLPGVARADLYIRARNGTEYFFEIKSPDINKGQCLEVTQRLLRFHLLHSRDNPDMQTYLALPYNPYGPERSDYRWMFPQTYMPFDAVLIGQEFWRIIGGETALVELLAIYDEVGREMGEYMIRSLTPRE